MIIGVLNYSGNVGKTEISKNLLKPRMDNADIFAIESINSGNEGDIKLKGNEVKLLIAEILTSDNAVVDIGSSNVELFLHNLAQFEGGHDLIDLFVVPAISEKKITTDTIATIDALAELGVPANKIIVIFNRLPINEPVDDVFGPLIAYHQHVGRFTYNPNACIRENEVYGSLNGRSITEVAMDGRDIKGLIKKAKNKDEKFKLANDLGTQMLAKKEITNLDAVFREIMIFEAAGE